jgi:hypothetical protein
LTQLADLLAAADELTDPRRHVEVNRCVVCPQLRAGRTPRHYHQPHVCEGCRLHLGRILTDIADCYTDLPGHLERGVGWGQFVRGGEVEAPLPFREDVWDLLLPVQRHAVVTNARTAEDRREDLLCQVGYLSVATVLYGWVDDWCHTRGKREIGPGTEVRTMAVWFTDRLDWACTDHPAVDEFAHEMNTLLRAIRRYVGRDEPKAEPCIGVPCRRCDLKSLARLADGSGDIECQNAACRTVYRPAEYTRWVRLLAAAIEHQGAA